MSSLEAGRMAVRITHRICGSRQAMRCMVPKTFLDDSGHARIMRTMVIVMAMVDGV